MESTAVNEGDYYILNGQKTWISLCDTADHFLVFAYTDKAQKHHGISAFIVERYLRNTKAPVIYEGTREVHTIMQAEYVLAYRQDKPLNHMLPAWEGNSASVPNY